MSWEGLKNKVTNAVGDLSRIDVLTLSGTVESSIVAGGGGKGALSFDWNAAKDKVSVVAATQVSLDYDTLYFQATDADADLVQMHQDNVKMATDGRAAFVKSILDLVK